MKKIGGMTYIVRVHFSTTSKETFSDKVKRLLRNEVRQLMEQEAAGE
ncbi:transposon-encoded TnpW family protein [uncultured Oscillibacter sp.]